MVKRKSAAVLVIALWVPWIPFLAGSAGCGGGSEAGGGGFALLAPDLQRLTSRLQAHYETVQGLLGPSRAADAPPDWDAVQREREEYGQQMRSTLDDLGEKAAAVGNCRMTMGGMMKGPPDGAACPCQPYVGDVSEELEAHLSKMLAWMDLEDPGNLWQEMQRHMEEMGSHLEDMASHMGQVYGPHGVMGGGVGSGMGMGMM